MKRAVYERITPFIESLPPKYTVNTPDLYATTSPETRQATKAHDYSVNWIVDHGQPEIVNGSTGKTINDNTSRLSKKCRKYCGMQDVTSFLLLDLIWHFCVRFTSSFSANLGLVTR